MIDPFLSRRSFVLGSAGLLAASTLPVRGSLAQGEASPAAADLAENQEFRLASRALDVNLDPHLTYNVRQIGLFSYFLWAGLTKLDANLQAAPDIATRWDISEDGRTYTFHLDPERRFADGSPITANDVVWSWTRSLDPATESLVAGGYLVDVVGAEEYWNGSSTEPPTGYRAIDDVTFEVTLKTAKNYFPAVLIHPSTFVVKQSDVEAGSADEPWYTKATAFSGPYAIEEYVEGQSLALRPNTHHPIPHTIARVSYRLVDDAQTQFLLFENDEVDFTQIGVPEADNIKNNDETYRDQLLEQPLWYSSNLYLRTGLAPFDDEQVRRAFMLAIDEQAILDTVLRGLYPDIEGIFYPGLTVYNPDIAGPSFDAEAAKAALAGSSYGGADGLPPISFWLTDEARTDTQGRIAAALQEMWRQHLGVEVETRIVPSYGEMLDSDVQIVIADEALHYPHASNAVSYLRCEGDANIAQFCDPAWEARIQEAASVPDEARSIELYQEAERAVIERAVLYPMYQRVEYFLIKPRVRNVALNPKLSFSNFDQVLIAAE